MTVFRIAAAIKLIGIREQIPLKRLASPFFLVGKEVVIIVFVGRSLC